MHRSILLGKQYLTLRFRNVVERESIHLVHHLHGCLVILEAAANRTNIQLSYIQHEPPNLKLLHFFAYLRGYRAQYKLSHISEIAS